MRANRSFGQTAKRKRHCRKGARKATGKFWQTYGVDGHLICRFDRTDPWSFSLDPQDAARARHIHVFHTLAPPTFIEVLDKLKKDVHAIYELILEAANIVHVFNSQGDTSKTNPKTGV